MLILESHWLNGSNHKPTLCRMSISVRLIVIGLVWGLVLVSNHQGRK